MTITSIYQVIGKCLPEMRGSQQKTLSSCVYGTLKRPTGKLTDMARGMGGYVSLRDRLKRVIRFLGNRRVLIEDIAPQFLSWLIARQGPLLPVVVLMDWTEEHGRHALFLSLKWGRRAIPFYWYCVEKGGLSRSRNTIEATALRLLRSWLPENKIIVIADRGFSRSSLYRVLLWELKMDFIIRIPKSTHILSREYQGALEGVRVYENKIRDFQHASLGAHAKRPMRIVVKKAKCDGVWTTWYLATSLQTERKETVVKLYEHRMGIECSFKDLKTNLGWRFQGLITTAERTSRYLFILVTAMIVAILTAGRKLAYRYKPLVAHHHAFGSSKTASEMQLGIWLIQHLADQKTMIHPRRAAWLAA